MKTLSSYRYTPHYSLSPLNLQIPRKFLCNYPYNLYMIRQDMEGFWVGTV